MKPEDKWYYYKTGLQEPIEEKKKKHRISKGWLENWHDWWNLVGDSADHGGEATGEAMEEQNLRGVDGVGEGFSEARCRAIIGKTLGVLRNDKKNSWVLHKNEEKYVYVVDRRSGSDENSMEESFSVSFDIHSSTVCFVDIEGDVEKLLTLKFISNESNSQIAYQIADAIKDPDKVKSVEKPEKQKSVKSTKAQVEEWELQPMWGTLKIPYKTPYLTEAPRIPGSWNAMRRLFGPGVSNRVGSEWSFVDKVGNWAQVILDVDSATDVLYLYNNYAPDDHSFRNWLESKLKSNP